MTKNSDFDSLFEEVSLSRFNLGQVAPDGASSPTYKLLREPNSLDEILKYERRMIIWRDNGTRTYVSTRDLNNFPQGLNYFPPT
jgi:hypothetical protein